ncbi:unnamed protein product [Ceratitis capitata]|uniref:(Mediterranean fruit fly) hypothetical protein n=1 Tax=Ceratitis capitata TaxID=7213 RepID=A0A811VET9_CERCA|nr:unnamed protein product [Ceratitis capitata]
MELLQPLTHHHQRHFPHHLKQIIIFFLFSFDKTTSGQSVATLRSPRPNRAGGGYFLTGTSHWNAVESTGGVHSATEEYVIKGNRGRSSLEAIARAAVAPLATSSNAAVAAGGTSSTTTTTTATTTRMIAPRYRFRDLLLGDFSFNDDGER